jgi:hypothetical protein
VASFHHDTAEGHTLIVGIHTYQPECSLVSVTICVADRQLTVLTQPAVEW